MHGIDTAEMSLTRMMWVRACMEQEEHRRAKRTAWAGRVAQATDEEYRKAMKD